MMVPVNPNLDAYKDDFFKGLTMRQTLYAVSAVSVSGLMMSFFLLYLKLNASLAMYMTLPVAFPIIAAGFIRIHGISFGEYLRRKQKVDGQPLFFFQPEMLLWLNIGMSPSDEKTEVKKDIPKKLYLETEVTIGEVESRQKESEMRTNETNERLQGPDKAAVPPA